eukprot:gene32325-16897_t
MDRTEEFWSSIVSSCQQNGIPQERVTQIRSASILRTTKKQKSAFITAAVATVLHLAERLHSVSSSFDRFRSERYQQLVSEEDARKRGFTVPNGGKIGKKWPSLFRPKSQAAVPGGQKGGSSTASESPSTQNAFTGDGQQQQMLEDANRHLVAQLQDTNTQVVGLERTLQEIATLNQMFSTAVLHQAAAIETIYENALDASLAIKSGNLELKKTVAVNRSTQKYIFYLLLACTMGLLIFDWLMS